MDLPVPVALGLEPVSELDNPEKEDPDHDIHGDLGHQRGDEGAGHGRGLCIGIRQPEVQGKEGHFGDGSSLPLTLDEFFY